MKSKIKLIECPRDAIQGLKEFVPTAIKAKYINSLLQVGFDTIDFGSFVSHKAVPQMSDTSEVLSLLDLTETKTKLLAIVANERGATDALQHPEIHYLGYPLSISETFQQRNTNKSIVEALNEVERIQNLCISENRVLVVYLSMGFGNPYGDPYDWAIVEQFISILVAVNIEIISIADTVGIATAKQVSDLFTNVNDLNLSCEIGAHLHAHPKDVESVIAAALKSGIQRMDSAMLGFGGCPMAEDNLVGNLPTEQIITHLPEQSRSTLDMDAFSEARRQASSIFL